MASDFTTTRPGERQVLDRVSAAFEYKRGEGVERELVNITKVEVTKVVAVFHFASGLRAAQK